VARTRLVFTARDVTREARQAPHLTLDEPAELHRHLTALIGTVLIDAGRGPLDEVAAGADGASEAQPPAESTAASRRVRRFVHVHRAEEWARAGGLASDGEKVYVALAVAILALRQRSVPTRTVTRVLHLIEPLRLSGTQQTNVVLSALARRSPPLVQREPSPDGWSADWTLVGEAPPEIGQTTWVQEVRALEEADGALPLSGAPSRNVQMRLLVRRTIEWSVCADWPAGRPVSATDIRLCAASDPLAAHLLTAVTARGRGLGAALHEAVRSTTTPAVTRVEGPADARRVWYDMPSLSGGEARTQFANLELARTWLSDERVRRLDHERRTAEALSRLGPSTAGLAAVRLLTVALEVRRATDLCDHVAARRHLMGARPRAELDQLYDRLRSNARLLTVQERCVDDAHAALLAVGAHPVTWALDVERPYFTAQQFVQCAPPGWFGGDSPATVIARATTLARFPNPNHTRRSDVNPDAAASVVVDRPEALLHLAESGRALLLPFLQAGFGLLGRYLRDARVVRPLLRDADARVRQCALAALVLLDDGEAVTTARRWLDDPTAAPDVIVSALYALHVQRALVPAQLPVHVRTSRAPLVARTLRAVLDGARAGRWLLQT